MILLDSLAKGMVDNKLVLDYLLAGQGEIDIMINKTCSPYMNNSGHEEKYVKKFMIKPKVRLSGKQ